MSNQEKNKTIKVSKKEILQAVSSKLSISFIVLKDKLGEKKFKKRIKKVTKLLTDGLKKIPAKNVTSAGKTLTVKRKKSAKILSVK